MRKPSNANEEASGRASREHFLLSSIIAANDVRTCIMPRNQISLFYCDFREADGLTRGARASVYCRLIDVCSSVLVLFYCMYIYSCRRGEGNCQKIVPDDCHEIRLDCARLGWKFIYNSAAQTYNTHRSMRINLD